MLAFFSCKNNSPSVSNKEVEKKDSSKVELNTPQKVEKSNSSPEIKADSTKYTLVIMFYSIGEGIENEYVRALEDSISSFSAQIKKNIDYQKTSWGREGETDFCMQLFELTDVEKAQFISQMKMQLKKAKWVNIFENYPCMHRKRTK